MRRIILSVILLHSLLKCVNCFKYGGFACGFTPKYPSPAPDEYSWTASLVYGTKPLVGLCSGSVINSRYVLTTATCVAGDYINELGGLTGVRLGDYCRNPVCDYGSDDCEHYQHFGILRVIVHRNYKVIDDVPQNNIALLRLNRSIIFTEKLKPICLTFYTAGLPENPSFNISGWGKLSGGNNDKRVRSTKTIQILNQDLCIEQADKTICAGNTTEGGLCHGNSGSPLMYEFEADRMALEGILSYRFGDCSSKDTPHYFTNVRSFQYWIGLNSQWPSEFQKLSTICEAPK